MTKQFAQVYIATTKGLVQIQAITPLNGEQLQSIVTINKSVQVAGISQDYQYLVGKTQGIIQARFGGSAYRMNISSAIDVGKSWHLGAYIAHCLQNHEALSESNTDVIFIVSGEIDTLNRSVMKVTDLSQKCLFAQAHIQQWLKEGKQIYFLVPQDNFRQPLPDVQMPLTPVKDITQVEMLLASLDLLLIPQGSPANIATAMYEPFGNSSSKEAITEDKSPLIIEANKLSWLNAIGKPLWLSIGMLCIATIGLFFYRSDVGLNKPQFRVEGDFSQNKANCKQAISHVIGQGHLLALTTIQASPLAHLCDARLITSMLIKTVWMLDENGQLLTLPQGENAQGEMIWQLMPLSQLSQSTQYYLLAFTQKMDVADAQSLAHFLKNTRAAKPMNNQQHNLSDLRHWAASLNIRVYFLSHELLI